jgi:hypothetical protein
VYFFTECILPIVSCCNSSPGANPRHIILRVYCFLAPGEELVCRVPEKRHHAKTKVHIKDTLSVVSVVPYWSFGLKKNIETHQNFEIMSSQD